VVKGKTVEKRRALSGGEGAFLPQVEREGMFSMRGSAVVREKETSGAKKI